MDSGQAFAMTAATYHAACGENVAYTKKVGKGMRFCPKCGNWTDQRVYDSELGFCNNCAHPKACAVCGSPTIKPAYLCTTCREHYYSRIKYLQYDKGLTKDEAIQQIREESGHDRSREVHSDSYERHSNVQALPASLGLDESEPWQLASEG